MIKNPEIQRRLWTDFTLHRLVAIPVALMLLFVAVYYANEAESKAIRALFFTSLFVFVVFTTFWGAIMAGRSVTTEITGRTWDYQRLSSQTPWELLLGKLIGSTMYVWYGGAFAYIVAILFFHTVIPKEQRLVTALLMIVGTLAVHAVIVLNRLSRLQYKKYLNKKDNGAFFLDILYLIIIGKVFSLINLSYNITNNRMVVWHGIHFNIVSFQLLSAFFLLVWALCACHEKVCQQLRIKITPSLVILSPVLLAVYLVGFAGLISEILITSNKTYMLLLFVVYWLFLASMYRHLFAEPWSGTDYRRMIDLYRLKNYLEIMYDIPRWLLLLPCVLGCILIMFAWDSFRETGLVILCVTTLLFALRDIMIFHCFKFTPTVKSPVMTTMFYLVCLYFLVPFLAHALSSPEPIQELFLPYFKISLGEEGIISVLSGAAQFIIAGYWATRQWKKYWVDV